METTMKAGITYTYNRNELNKKICDTIEFIKKIAKENDYQIKGDIEKYNDFSVYLEKNWNKLSMNQMKKIQKYCYWIHKNPSLKKINTFLGILSRVFGIERAHILISYKELCIQATRKEWIKARNEADRLLNVYKLTKGDFYKKK